MRRARHEQVGEIDRQQRFRRRGGQFDGHLVDLARAAQVGMREAVTPTWLGVEMRRVLLQHLLDVPDHRVGVEVGAVVEFHAGAQLEDPLGLVVRRRRPFGREAGDDHARLVGRGQVPQRETLVHGVAGEAVALEALVGLAEGARDVGGGHADPDHGLRRGRGGGYRQQRARAAITAFAAMSFSSSASLLERNL